MKTKGRFFRWLWALIWLAACWPPFSARAETFAPPPAEVAVKLKPNVSLQTILARYNASTIGHLTETNLYFLRLNGQDAAAVLPAMNADADLYYAEPNYYADAINGQARYINGHIAYFDGSARYITGHTYTTTEARYISGHEGSVPAPSGDPHWAWQRVGLADARRVSDGQGVIVAVLDSGLAADHPLLSSSLVAGYDFVAMKEQILDQGNGLDDDGDGAVDEQTGHGTHVAGIVLSAAPGVQVMPIRVLNSDGIGTYWEVAAGIRFAVDHGAKVINMSLSAPLLPPSLESALAYAAQRNVLIVAASGDGAGPNYPAAYTNRLAVLGVGATDLNDAALWFSGGLPEHTDIYAPGLNVYSSYPYNQYVYASGTSMAAPLIAGAAALLIARHPEWQAEQVAERILATTDPVGLTAGRADLAAALNTGLEVRYLVGDPGQPANAQIAPRLLLINNTPEDIPLSQLALRYWYTVDGSRPQSLSCDYASLPVCAAITSQFGTLTAPAADTWAQVGFTAAAGSLPAGGKLELLLRLNKDNWSNYNESDDYSFTAGQASFAPASRITAYRNGALTWGVEPVGGIPATVAPTSIAATATPGSAVEVVYQDGTAWENWSWGVTLDFASTSLVHGGTKSLACTFTVAWAGLSLHRVSPLAVSAAQSIRFWVYASGSGTRPLWVYVHNANGAESVKAAVDVAAGQWVQVAVPFSSLGSPAEISRINIQDRSGSAQAVMYMDDVSVGP